MFKSEGWGRFHTEVQDVIMQRLMTQEAAAREAVAHSDGAVCIRTPTMCSNCRQPEEAVWFHSRGWVCCGCDQEVSGITPTPEQRKAGQPNGAAIEYVQKHCTGKYDELLDFLRKKE